jgi:hypothetical protein
VRAVRQHDRGNAEPLVALCVPEIRTVEQSGLLLKREIGQQGRQIDASSDVGHVLVQSAGAPTTQAQSY